MRIWCSLLITAWLISGCQDPTADRDGDGAVAADDCDDRDPGIFPGNPEVIADGVDQDCSGADAVLCFFDGDADGWGFGAAPDLRDDDGVCSDDPFQAAFGGDCDDSRAEVTPNGTEVLDDGIDQDCSGADRVTCWPDADGDGVGASGTPTDAEWPCADAGLASADGDCDDTTDAIQPGALEIADDGIDQDCSGADTISCFFDGDGDGWGWPVASLDPDGSCDPEQDQAAVTGDCDDSRADIFPGAPETPDDSVDQDCTGADARTCYADADGDGIGAGPIVLDLLGPCGATPGLSWWDTDCDDGDGTSWPGGVEIADDGVDQDCSGVDTVTCLYDGDADGYGADGTGAPDADGACLPATLQATVGGDCDDSQATIYPGALEIADDGFDQNCDGADTVTCWLDTDGDTFGGAAQFDFDGSCTDDVGQVDNDGDCDDADPAAYPYAPETADDGVDQDCDGFDATACWYDGDGDGYGDASGPLLGLDGTCSAAALAATSDDCDDTDPSRSPGAVEACNSVDDDCDGTIDHGLLAAFLTPGAGDRIILPPIPVGSAITVEAWVRPRAGDWQPGPALAKERSGVGEDLALGVDAGNVPTADVVGAGGTDTVTGGAAPAWTWTHLAATYDGAEQRLYVNGVLVGVSSGVGALALDTTGGWSIGAGFDAAGLPVDHWWGAIDDVRIWSTARTEPQIADTRCAVPDAADPTLIAWWPLEGDLLDAAGSGYDGVGVGALAFFGR